MTYPRVPTRSAGTTIACHPFAIASAAAVVGPPIFAFDAIQISSRLNLKILPNTKETIMFIPTMIAQNTRSNGACVTIR